MSFFILICCKHESAKTSLLGVLSNESPLLSRKPNMRLRSGTVILPFSLRNLFFLDTLFPFMLSGGIPSNWQSSALPQDLDRNGSKEPWGRASRSCFPEPSVALLALQPCGGCKRQVSYRSIRTPLGPVSCFRSPGWLWPTPNASRFTGCRVGPTRRGHRLLPVPLAGGGCIGEPCGYNGVLRCRYIAFIQARRVLVSAAGLCLCASRARWSSPQKNITLDGRRSIA